MTQSTNLLHLLHISNMTCAGCAEAVQQSLCQVPGVRRAEVSYATGRAKVETDGTAAVGALIDAVRVRGYDAAPIQEQSKAGGRTQQRKVVIIGAGSAAFAAALVASKEGAEVTLIEAGMLGGTCVNIGCVPSKFQIRAAQVAHTQAHAPYAGLPNHPVSVDRQVLVSQQQILVDRMRQDKYEAILQSNPAIHLVRGHARFKDPHTLTIRLSDGGEQELTAERILIATGASPAIPEVPGLKGTPFWTSATALTARAPAAHLIVYGGGAVALELAQIHRRLGARVTLIARSTLLRREEPSIGAGLRQVFEDEGMRVLTHAEMTGVRFDGMQFTVAIGHDTVRADRLLIATGRVPNTAGLDLLRAGVVTDARGAIAVDASLRTSVEHIFAAGDCAALPEYVYVAAAAGGIAAANLLGGDRKLDLSVTPGVVFTDPQVATVGLSEEQAKQRGIDCECRTLTLDNVARAQVNLDTRGFVKLVAEKGTLRLIGAQMLAGEAGEAIQTAALAIRNRMTVPDLAGMLFPYLTMVEALRLCALSFSVNVKELSCCAA